jgi:hypothetical protein
VEQYLHCRSGTCVQSLKAETTRGAEDSVGKMRGDEAGNGR